MKLGDLDFHIDEWTSLSYRDLIDFKSFLETGLASQFWSAYVEIIEGNRRGFETAILNPASVGLDQAFATERNRGSYLATKILSGAMETLLEEVQAEIATRQATENYNERREQQQPGEPRPADGDFNHSP